MIYWAPVGDNTSYPTDLVVRDAPDHDVVILPVTKHALHHTVQLTVIGQDPILESLNVNDLYSTCLNRLIAMSSKEIN